MLYKLLTLACFARDLRKEHIKKHRSYRKELITGKCWIINKGKISMIALEINRMVTTLFIELYISDKVPQIGHIEIYFNCSSPTHIYQLTARSKE